MALNAVLSAMREIILDTPPLPSTENERLKFFERRFPALSKEEREDLAKIDPQRFEIYTTSIFSGEKGILEKHFRITFALLARFWPKIYNQPFNAFSFVKELHALRPWRGNKTTALANCFLAHISQDRPELTRMLPYIEELAELEYLNLLIKRTPSENVSAANSLSSSAIAELTVEELLAKSITIPSYVQLYRFTYNITTYWREYYNNHKSLPELAPIKLITWAVGGRTLHNFVSWSELSPNIYQLLESRPRTTTISVAELAENFLEHAAPEQSEELLFAAFMQELQGMLSVGMEIIDTGTAGILPANEWVATT